MQRGSQKPFPLPITPNLAPRDNGGIIGVKLGANAKASCPPKLPEARCGDCDRALWPAMDADELRPPCVHLPAACRRAGTGCQGGG